MMNNALDLALLRSFIALMDTHSVSAAARQLKVSQPTMSRSLAKLRTIFEDPLLVRSRNGMLPTERAVDLYETAGGVLAGIDTLLSHEKSFDPRKSPTKFVISATEYVEYVLLPRLTLRTPLEQLAIDLEVTVPLRQTLWSGLESGEIDAFAGFIIDPPPVLRSRPLFTDRLVCIARKNHPGLKGRLSSRQFLELPHARPALVGGAMSEQIVDAAAAKLGRSLRILVNVKNYLTIPFIVAQSDMIATVPFRLASQFAGQLQLQILEPPIDLPEFRYALYWHERRHQDARHKWLRRALVDAAHGL